MRLIFQTPSAGFSTLPTVGRLAGFVGPFPLPLLIRDAYSVVLSALYRSALIAQVHMGMGLHHVHHVSTLESRHDINGSGTPSGHSAQREGGTFRAFCPTARPSLLRRMEPGSVSVRALRRIMMTTRRYFDGGSQCAADTTVVISRQTVPVGGILLISLLILVGLLVEVQIGLGGRVH